ncbi:sterol desaturase family protein [Candidatus Pantoea multigeneris]|uniref:Sterol desaturase family protein n=1 Tax=Candidatus Pantoea multigeneris TaxID=2608357 RepID=A0ABX0R7U7_9GAMM|nr:sterol desaturase family protein [Pantoea multigeneris]NIF21162.1 sterol desaturase family protein [Pantoea multigeneris]
MSFLLNHYLITWFVLLFMIEFAIYFRNTVKNARFKQHWATNVTTYLASKIFTLLFFVPMIAFSAHHPLTSFIGRGGQALAIIAGVVLLDIAGYFFHRLSHEIEFLWKFHEIHHLDEYLDVTTGLRVHFLEIFFHTLVSCAVIMLFGINAETIVIHSLIAFVLATYHHSRFYIPIKVEEKLSWFITTPRFHEPHHDKQIENNQSNYAFIFPIWDRIFGSFHKDSFKRNWDYGLAYKEDVSPIESIIRPLRKEDSK